MTTISKIQPDEITAWCGGNVAEELHLLSEDPQLDRNGAGPVMLRVSLSRDAAEIEPPADDGSPRLVFRALFKENEAASDWEARLNERLQESGVKVGNEFFFVNGPVVEGLCAAAAYADEHEWLVPPTDTQFFELAMQCGRAKRAADEAFEEWSRCERSDKAEIKINSCTQYIARDERRVRDLQGRYATPRLFNDAASENARIDYAISQLQDQLRNWRSEIKRLRAEIEANNVAFAKWQETLKRVAELDAALAKMAPEAGTDES